jgi:hypothetical protein
MASSRGLHAAYAPQLTGTTLACRLLIMRTQTHVSSEIHVMRPFGCRELSVNVQALAFSHDQLFGGLHRLRGLHLSLGGRYLLVYLYHMRCPPHGHRVTTSRQLLVPLLTSYSIRGWELHHQMWDGHNSSQLVQGPLAQYGIVSR